MKIASHTYTADHTNSLHDHGVDVLSREIWLVPNSDYAVGVGDTLPSDPGVDYTMTTKFLKNLHLLMNSAADPILIHMKTFGGDWDQGMAIYDAIKTCPCHITIVNYTAARSMSSLILCAANRRVMMPHGKFMFHNGSMSYEGTAKQFLTEARELVLMDAQMMAVYVDRMKATSRVWKYKSKEACETWLKSQMNLKEEVYLNAKDAIKHGFADEIFDGNWDRLLTT